MKKFSLSSALDGGRSRRKMEKRRTRASDTTKLQPLIGKNVNRHGLSTTNSVCNYRCVMYSNSGSDKIYLDYNATTPLADEVIASIAYSLTSDWGNPSSSHYYGKKSKISISQARNQIAKMLNGKSSEITFTSGGTESNNMIINGIPQYFKEYQGANAEKSNNKPHIITSNVEHDSVILPIMQLKKLSLVDCTIVKVNETGMIEVDAVISKIRKNTCLISIMSANNETGVIMPISQIGDRLKAINAEREKRNLIKVLFHTDAAQIIGKDRVDAVKLKVDYITVVGHKFYGPRIGCVWAKGPLYPVFYGGGQESNIRPGTENTPMIVGLGKAAELVESNLEKYKSHMLSCRNRLEAKLREVFGEGIVFNCKESLKLANTLNVSFVGEGLEGDLVLGKCRHLIASVGAACHGGQCSQILINSGVPAHLAKNAIRLSVGRETILDDIETVVMDLAQAVNKLKNNVS